jgi:DNA polymerase-3 subunit gamma/tau
MVFDDIVGQSHINTTLRNAIATNRLSHAYIFSGPRGVGKTTTARILAKAVNCLHPKEFNPDNTCDLCREITEGRSVNVFEIDGASNRGVDEIRNLREAVRYAPAKGKVKIYIIDEVHMLTKEAFNALLKTLEEPPPYVIFIFATTEIHKVPLTILSRCQRFDFRRITIEEITGRLRFIAREEKIAIDDDALLIIAKRGDGSMRDAQSIFDQVVSFCGTTISAKEIISMLNIVDEEMFFRVTALIRAKDVKGGLLLVEEVMSGGFDIKEFLSGLSEHFRNLLVALSTGSTKLIESSSEYKKRYAEESKAFSETDLLRLIKITGETEAAIKWSQQPRLKLEIGLMEMIKIDGSVEIASLIEQIEELKKNASPPRPSPPRTPALRAGLAGADTPIRGSVRATPPTLRPDQVVNAMFSAPPPFTFSPAVQPGAIQPVALPSPQGWGELVISADEAAGKWPALIEEAMKQRIALGTILSAASLIGVQNNMLRVGCPDDFHLDELRRNRQFLQEIAQRIYGAKVQLEAIISQQHEPVPTSAASGTSPAQQHPVLQALIREFGARELE